jgi:hypothetical protein
MELQMLTEGRFSNKMSGLDPAENIHIRAGQKDSAVIGKEAFVKSGLITKM